MELRGPPNKRSSSISPVINLLNSSEGIFPDGSFRAPRIDRLRRGTGIEVASRMDTTDECKGRLSRDMFDDGFLRNVEDLLDPVFVES